jgi:hypothetical protein
MHRIDGALGRHHRRGADLEHLHDVRCLFGAEGRDRAGHHLRVSALVDGDDLEVLLRAVEIVREFLHALAHLTGHGVPELDLGLRERGRAGQEAGSDRGASQ